MPERGLAVKDRLVLPIMQDVKIVTRRVITEALYGDQIHTTPRPGAYKPDRIAWWKEPGGWIICRHGDPGDAVYIREALARVPVVAGEKEAPTGEGVVSYATDGELVRPIHRWEWKNSVLPARYMPKWAARTVRLLDDVHPERLSAIDDTEALDEGIEFATGIDLFGRGPTTHQEILEQPRRAFLALWDLINGPRGMGTDRDPWVWAIAWRPGSEEQRAEVLRKRDRYLGGRRVTTRRLTDATTAR